MTARFRINDEVQVTDSATARLWPGRWSRFPHTGDLARVLDFEGPRVVVERTDPRGNTQWIASFDPAALDLVRRPAS
jgi:hypothetical protein